MDKYYEFKNIRYKYNDNIILDNLDLVVNKNKITTISGPNGSGKSSLAKYLKKEKTSKLVLLESDIEKNKTLSVLDVIKKYSRKSDKEINKEINNFKKVIDIEEYLPYNFSKINNGYKIQYFILVIVIYIY